MKIHFWGVRGSLPTPIVPEQIQSKIMAVVQRIQPSDLENGETRARFVASLPDWILGTTGGNTPCVEIQDGNTEIILDAGTGIRVLGKNPSNITSNHFHLFFSHFHWDHIQGLPFFDQAYNPNTIFDIYSAKENTEELLREQMKHPYYPVSFDSLTKNMTFHNVKQGQAFQVDSFKVNCCNMSHPGVSTSYAFEKDYRKANWGHSAFCYAVDFAVHWNIKKIYLFHHEPTYDDKKLDSILNSARWYANYINHSSIQIELAKEGTEINL